MTFECFADPPLPKPSKKFDSEEKESNELLRQFKVKITNIEVINESKSVMDPFIRIIIGGTYFIQIKNRGQNVVYEKQGFRGVSHVTDVITFLEPNDSRFCQRAIDTMYDASYF